MPAYLSDWNYGFSDPCDLALLRLHWGDVYDITHRPGEAWMATRPGSAPLIAETATELLVLIRADWARGGKRQGELEPDPVQPTDQGSM